MNQNIQRNIVRLLTLACLLLATGVVLLAAHMVTINRRLSAIEKTVESADASAMDALEVAKEVRALARAATDGESDSAPQLAARKGE